MVTSSKSKQFAHILKDFKEQGIVVFLPFLDDDIWDSVYSSLMAVDSDRVVIVISDDLHNKQKLSKEVILANFVMLDRAGPFVVYRWWHPATKVKK